MAATKTLPRKPYFKKKRKFLRHKLIHDTRALDELRSYQGLFPEVEMALCYYGLNGEEPLTLEQVALEFGCPSNNGTQYASDRINGLLAYLGSRSVKSQASAIIAREIHRRIVRLQVEHQCDLDKMHDEKAWQQHVAWFGLKLGDLPHGLDPNRLYMFADVYKRYHSETLLDALQDQRLASIIISRFGLRSKNCVTLLALSKIHQVSRQRTQQLERQALQRLGLVV